jgi:L-threonylcarbamoyladenylate synthase
MNHYTQKDKSLVISSFKQGDVLAFPTDTVYGVGTMYGNMASLERLKAAKHRPETKPIPLMTGSWEQLEQLAEIDDESRKLKVFLPGALTLILPISDKLDSAYFNGLFTAAFRIPDDDFLLGVMQGLPNPLMVSSANISGMPAALHASQAEGMLKDIDGVIKGECAQLEASTIVDCTCRPFKILRPGPITREMLEKCVEIA